MPVLEMISQFLATVSNSDFMQFMPQDCEFKWKVPCEDTLTKHVLWSSVFPKDSDSHFKWEVLFVNYVQPPSFFLKLKEKRICDLDISVECSFFVKTEDGSTVTDKKGRKLNDKLWGIQLFGNCCELSSKIGKVPLIFGARVSARYDINPIILKGCIGEKYHSHSSQDGTLSDAILRTEKDGKLFNVHRFMLTSRSKVFAAMFSNEMEEKLTGIVNIREFSGYIMRYILYFIYNGTVNFRGFSVALSLLEPAEYFDLKDLKTLLAIHLLRFVDHDHAWQILLNAHLFGVEDLKAITLEYIRVYKRELCDYDEYHTFPKDLLLDIIKAFSKKKGFEKVTGGKL